MPSIRCTTKVHRLPGRGVRFGLASIAVFAAAVTMAFAQVQPISPLRLVPPSIPHGIATPHPGVPTAEPLPSPIASQTPASAAMHTVLQGRPRGSVVPLSLLPPLPQRTTANGYQRRVHIQAATGATLNITPNGGNANCVLSVGTLIVVNCDVFVQSSGLTGGDTFQDYDIAPNVADGTAGTAISGTYTNGNNPTSDVTLGAAGVWVFGTLDVTTNKWVAVVYVTVSESFVLRVYQDSFHTQETYQFAAGTSSSAYIYATNLTASDYYVVYAESTSINPHCVFSSPIQSSMPANALCQPNLSVGQQAPGGNLQVAWAIAANLPAGTYSIALFDKTTNQRVAQVQVSVTGSSGAVMLLHPDTTAGTATNPSPAPAPVATPGTEFAWDSANDQSVSGVNMTVNMAPNSSYEWTISDPTGATTFTNGPVNTGGNASNLFNFMNGASSPGNYVSRSFSAALYDNTAKAVYASQFFQLVGYYASTTYNANATTLTVAAGGSTTSNLTFTNNSPERYGALNSDNFSKIAYTTGTDFTHNVNNGNGVTVTLPGKTLAQCQGAGCSISVTDSSGNAWTVTDICGGAGGASSANNECYIELDPSNPNNTLPANGTITITGASFQNFAGGGCVNSCELFTSVLPQHGVLWSSITSTDAFAPTYIAGGTSGGTASVALSGNNGPNYQSNTPQQIEAHLYAPYTSQAQYHRGSPYPIDTNYFDIFGFTVTNSSSQAINVLAFGEPGSYASFGVLDYLRLDPNLPNLAWNLDTGCTRALQAFGRKYFCLNGKGQGGGTNATIAPGQTKTIYIDFNAAPGSFNFADWLVFAANPNVFAMTASGVATIPVTSAGVNQSVDNLAYAQYSLDSSLMAASFAPASVGKSTSQPENIVVTNTSTAQDAFPDYLDTIIIAASNTYSTSGNPSVVAPPGWSYVATTAYNGQNWWWFSPCTNRLTSQNYLPPTSVPLTAPFANPQPECNANANALAPGASATFKFTLQNLNTTGSIPFTMYAHGANGGGWSQGKVFDLLVNTVSAGVGFSKAGGYPTPATVATNTLPTIGGNPNPTYGNAFVYTVTNNSGAGQNMTSFRIRIPGVDTSGVNATDSSGNVWHVTGAIPTLGGNVDGCTVTNTLAAETATSGGADGEIDIGGGGCALIPGDTMTLSFTMLGPQSEGDTYPFGTYCINNTGGGCTIANPGNTGGANWIGDDEVQVQLTVGLSVVVDPSNPGPGGSTPVVSCSTCAFSGSTVDFGTFTHNSTTTFGDTVRASIIMQSSTALTYTLSVQANNNPGRTPAAPTNELLMQDDSANSTSGAGITFDVPSYTVVPTGSAVTIANGTSVTTRTTPYDVLQNFELSIGTEPITAQQSIITYTLIAN